MRVRECICELCASVIMRVNEISNPPQLALKLTLKKSFSLDF